MINTISVTITPEELEQLGSELDAPPSVEVILAAGPSPRLPAPLKPVLRTRSAGVQPVLQRAKQILDFCQRRKITDLCHFTRVENLKGIFTEGLIPREELDKRPAHLRPLFPDHLRLDGNRDASCLSISFPNYKMFYSKRIASAEDALWAVLIYDYSILTRLNCAFTVHNAASNRIQKNSIKTCNSVDHLKELFADFGTIKRDALGIPNNYPTNPQAEVLAYDLIPTAYIKQVVFFSQRAAKTWLAENKSCYPLNRYWWSGPVFSCRMDFTHWKRELF